MTTMRKATGPGRAVLQTDWTPRTLPEGTAIEPVTLVTHDGAAVRGTLYTLAPTRTVVLAAHPRQDLQRAPHVPDLLAAGVAVHCQNTRAVGNDMTLTHEQALLDVAAAVEWLKERGFEHVVLLGVSGGAALLTYYAEQALLEPSERVAREPGGRPVDLAGAVMPAPDALALVAPHPGQGRLLGSLLDGSVLDEDDPLSCDPSLDPFSAANGFDPSGASYSPEFVARYREAQRMRGARIDERARTAIAAAREARSREDRRAALATPLVVTYRTDADLRCVDLSLEPSERRYGSLISAKPQLSNYGTVGFARVTTPHAWLSTWSAAHSNAALARAAAGVTVPALVVRYSADQSVFDSDVASLRAALASEDATFTTIRADHFGAALDPDGPDGIRQTVDALVGWMADRTPWE